MTTDVILAGVLLGLGSLVIGVMLMSIAVRVVSRHRDRMASTMGRRGSAFNR